MSYPFHTLPVSEFDHNKSRDGSSEVTEKDGEEVKGQQQAREDPEEEEKMEDDGVKGQGETNKNVDNNIKEADKTEGDETTSTNKTENTETTPPDIVTQKREVQAALKQQLKKGEVW